MLAVNSVFYRLFANVVRAVTTDWCVAAGTVPETQFGFYPGRDTAQPAFILRHLVHAAQQAKRKNERPNSHLFVAFMDFTQAYDRIDRSVLWSETSCLTFLAPAPLGFWVHQFDVPLQGLRDSLVNLVNTEPRTFKCTHLATVIEGSGPDKNMWQK